MTQQIFSKHFLGRNKLIEQMWWLMADEFYWWSSSPADVRPCGCLQPLRTLRVQSCTITYTAVWPLVTFFMFLLCVNKQCVCLCVRVCVFICCPHSSSRPPANLWPDPLLRKWAPAYTNGRYAKAEETGQRKGTRRAATGGQKGGGMNGGKREWDTSSRQIKGSFKNEKKKRGRLVRVMKVCREGQKTTEGGRGAETGR